MKIIKDYVEVTAEVRDTCNDGTYFLKGMIDFNDMGDIQTNAFDREDFFKELDKGFHLFKDRVIRVGLKFFGYDDMTMEVERD